MALGCLVEQVYTHRGSELLLQVSIDTVILLQMEFLAQELFILWCHILEGIGYHMLLLGHYLRTQGVINHRTERIIDANALLQGDDLVPMAHGLLLTSANEGVDGFECKTGSIIALGIHTHVYIGNG